MGKKCPLKTVALVVKLSWKSLAKVKQPKVARVELSAGGGIHGPEKVDGVPVARKSSPET